MTKTQLKRKKTDLKLAQLDLKDDNVIIREINREIREAGKELGKYVNYRIKDLNRVNKLRGGIGIEPPT